MRDFAAYCDVRDVPAEALDDWDRAMTALAVSVLATEEGQEQATQLPLPALVLGLGTFVLLLALLFITMQFNRNR